MVNSPEDMLKRWAIIKELEGKVIEVLRVIFNGKWNLKLNLNVCFLMDHKSKII